jgi:hypothetical protein
MHTPRGELTPTKSLAIARADGQIGVSGSADDHHLVRLPNESSPCYLAAERSLQAAYAGQRPYAAHMKSVIGSAVAAHFGAARQFSRAESIGSAN